jgi:hypothetical protein
MIEFGVSNSTYKKTLVNYKEIIFERPFVMVCD